MKIHPSSIQVAYVVGVQRGGRGKLNSSAKGEESAKCDHWDLEGIHACEDAIVFLVFIIHQVNVKILIGQN